MLACRVVGLILLFAAAASPAQAQTPPPMPTQIDLQQAGASVAADLASALTAQRAQLLADQREIAALHAQVDDLTKQLAKTKAAKP